MGVSCAGPGHPCSFSVTSSKGGQVNFPHFGTQLELEDPQFKSPAVALGLCLNFFSSKRI